LHLDAPVNVYTYIHQGKCSTHLSFPVSQYFSLSSQQLWQ
jgi:hypothetical protein